jgi:hypothetical protein
MPELKYTPINFELNGYLWTEMSIQLGYKWTMHINDGSGGCPLIHFLKLIFSLGFHSSLEGDEWHT